MNFEKIIQSYFDLNLNIQENFFKDTKFLDKELEKEYREEKSQKSRKNKIYIDAFIIFCMVTIIMYIWVHKYKFIFIYIGLACFVVSFILIAISHFKKSSRLDSVVYHVIIFLSSIFLNFKVIYIACFLNTPENDNDSEIIRTFVYDFIQKNILCLIALDTRFSTTLVLYLLNLSSSVVAEAKSNGNQFYYFDALVSLIVTICFYSFKKELEIAHRVTFADKYKFKKFYYYTREFINGYYLNISDDCSINCDSKMINLLREMNLDDGLGVEKFLQISNKNNINCEENKISDVHRPTSIHVSGQDERNWKLSRNFFESFTPFKDEESSNPNLLEQEENLREKLKND